MGLILRLRRQVRHPALWFHPGELQALGDERVIALLDASSDSLEDIGGWKGLVHSVREEGWPVELSLEQLDRRHVLEVLKDCGGRRGEAAERLGVNASTLYRWSTEKMIRRGSGKKPTALR